MLRQLFSDAPSPLPTRVDGRTSHDVLVAISAIGKIVGGLQGMPERSTDFWPHAQAA
jgi:hypothetical protein